MILAACLLVATGGVLVFGPSWLQRVTSRSRSPLATLVAWQMAAWTTVLAVLFAAALVAIPGLAVAARLPANVESCLVVLRSVPNPADDGIVQILAAAALVVMVLRLSWCAARGAALNHRNRARHRALLGLVGTPDAELGAHIVADPAPVAYCLPGRGGRVVFTSGALTKLDVGQRVAVLAHERAHLRGRHHLLVASASTLTRAFPRLSLFRHAHARTCELVEMRADDLASRRCGRASVAGALLALADMKQTTTVLAATAVTTADRIERLLHDAPPCPPARVRRAVSGAAMASMVAGSPILLATAGHAALCLL